MTNSPPRPAVPVWLRVVILLAILGGAWMSQRGTVPTTTDSQDSRSPVVEPKPVSVEVVGRESESAETKTQAAEPDREAQATDAADPAPKSLVISNVKLKDQSGRIIYQGDIDLEPTLDRIAAGELLDRFPNDGSTFQNREKRIPRQPSGHYREYVVPTPEQNGPGPQRLVIGRDHEVYYTHDHYKTFRRVR